MTELVMRKRAGHAGEIGLFLDTPVFEEEWSSLKLGSEVKAECTVPANLKYLKFFWALVGKVAENSPDGFLDKQDCADRILLEARHFKLVHDNLRNKSEIRVKSIAGLSGDTWIRLLRRVTDIVVMKFLPGMDRNVLTAEIEAMVGVATTTPDPEPPKQRQRAPRATKETPAKEPPQGDVGKEAQEPAVPSNTERSAPTNEAEYTAAARAWIVKQSASHEDARAYFEGDHHIELRRKCGVSIGVRNLLRRELAEKYEGKK